MFLFLGWDRERFTVQIAKAEGVAMLQTTVAAALRAKRRTKVSSS